MVGPRKKDKRKTRLKEVPIDLHNEQMILSTMMQNEDGAHYFIGNLRRSDFVGQRAKTP